MSGVNGVRTHKVNVFTCDQIGGDKQLEEYRLDVYRFDCSCGQQHFRVHNVLLDDWCDADNRDHAVNIAEEAAADYRKRAMN